MPSYIPLKKNDANGIIFYICVVSQANPNTFQSSPTIAAGDFKVSIDGGALTNLTTLPVVTPAASKMIKITLSQAEVNGDNITVVWSDAAGAEWCDDYVNLQSAARQLDDHCFPTTSGRSLDVTATGAAGIDWANVENPTTALNLSATNIDVDQVVASVSGAVASVTGAVGSVTAGVSVGVGGIASTSFAAGAIDAAAIAANAIGASELAADAANEIADALLARNIAGGSSAGRIVSEALYVLRNKVSIAAGTMTVTLVDDATTSWTAAVTTAAGNPISSIDPV